MKKRRIDLILLICLCVSACSVSLYSMPREWADLEEGEHRLYGSEKYKKYTIDNSLIQREKWEGHSSCMVLGLIKSTDYPKYTAFRFWPFYDTITSKIDARERTWSTLGLYYRKHDSREDYMRFFPLYSSLETRRKKDADILFFIRWGERRSTKHVRYFDIYPLYFDTDYNTADNSETGSAFLFIPFVYTTVTDRTLSGTSFHERKNMTLLWYYHSTAEQGREPRTSTTFFFPVIPLFYYHNDPGSRHINVLWLFDRETARGEVRRSMLLPLWYYTQDLGAPGHREETSASLFHYSNERSSPGPDGTAVIGEDTEWYPLLPLYYYSYTKGEGTHRNLLWLLDWRRSEDESLERFWGHPLVYYRPDSYLHVLPLFMSWEDQRTSTSLGLFWYYERTADKTGAAVATTKWFPIIPFLYYSSETAEEGSHRNMLALFDWAHDRDDNLTRFWFIPFVFHNTGEGSYRQYFPFYFKPSGWSEEEGSSFGLFHYHRWSRDEEVWWNWIHYSRRNTGSREEVSHWFPLYYSWKNVPVVRGPRSEGELFIPFYMNYEDRERNIHVNLLGGSKTVATGPLSPSLGLGAGGNSDGWYLDTDWSWLYDVVSLSTRTTVKNPFRRSAEKSPEPGEVQKDVPVDTGASETIQGHRTAQEVPSMKDQPGNTMQGQNDAAQRGPSTVIGRGKMVKRENAKNYWGWDVLFGLFSYRKADSWKQLRMPPIGWFSWDQSSDDKVFVTPVSISYKNEFDKTEYFAVYPILPLPLYGRRVEDRSYVKVYGIIAYWNEYDAERDYSEESIVWPFYNSYRSPERNGWRIFPVFWYKEKTETRQRSVRAISPVYYYHRNTISETDHARTRERVIAPFIYSVREEDNGNVSQMTLFPIVPICYYSHEERTEEYSSLANHDSAGESVSGERRVSRTTNWFLPLYYTSEVQSADSAGSATVRDYTWLGLPFVYYHARSGLVSESGEGGARPIESTLFFPGYYRYRNGNSEHTNILGLYDRTRDADTGDGRTMVLPLWVKSSEGGIETLTIPILLSRFREGPESREKTVFLLYWSGEDTQEGTEYRHLVPLWLSYEDRQENRSTLMVPVLPLFYNSTTRIGDDTKGGRSGTQFALPLYYRSYREYANTATGEERSESTLIGLPLLYYSGSSSRDGDISTSESTFFLLGYYRHRDSDVTHTNVLGLFNRRYDRAQQREENWIFPAYVYEGNDEEGYWSWPIVLSYYGWGKQYRQVMVAGLFWYRNDDAARETYLHLFPLYISRRSPDSYDYLVLGTYWHGAPGHSRQNIWYLYDHRHYDEGNVDRWSFLFGLAEYRRTDRLKDFNAALGLLAEYRNHLDSEDWRVSLLWLGYEHRGDYRKWNFLPVAYRSVDGEESYWVFPLALQYYHSYGDEVFHLVGLGALYYRNYRPEERRDRELWVLGAAYDYVQKPAIDTRRDYRSRGSLWGFLWEYETESVQDSQVWSQVSVLFKLYRRINDQGEIVHRVLGVTL